MDQEENKELVWKACNGSAIRIFYEVARNYVQFLKDNVIDESSAPELIEMLIDLYSQGSKLVVSKDRYLNHQCSGRETILFGFVILRFIMDVLIHFMMRFVIVN